MYHNEFTDNEGYSFNETAKSLEEFPTFSVNKLCNFNELHFYKKK